MIEEREKKRLKRKQLLSLLNQDPEWHKKDNDLVGAIQEKAKEISYPEQEDLMDLTVENYLKLCEANIPLKDMHRKFGLTTYKFLSWRKEHSFCKEIKIKKKKSEGDRNETNSQKNS